MTNSPLIPCQKTLVRPAHFAGIGLFTGQACAIQIHPASAGYGVVFQRIDLPGKPQIPALLEYVSETPRCTCLAKDDASVRMVEHILSALSGLGVNNAHIEVEGPEIPASDGSALEFVQMIERAGIRSLEAPRRSIYIEKAMYWSQGDCHLIALPSEGFRISYTLHYPQSTLIRSQYCSFFMTEELYRREIAPCRTFSLYEEIAPLLEKGVLKGGGLDKGLVIQGDQILNPEGSRFFDEMVRHKVLDLIGDLSLLGAPLEGHILAVRSGHASNVAFAKEIAKSCLGQASSVSEVGLNKAELLSKT